MQTCTEWDALWDGVQLDASNRTRKFGLTYHLGQVHHVFSGFKKLMLIIILERPDSTFSLTAGMVAGSDAACPGSEKPGYNRVV